ncbi:MFS transporter [Notoacmeibacter marinus]|uniref:MFS transporter n=1 Tax=Notoacmeibacter marinus TaxID=1876515 RepID=A0A231V3R3_9HYPH|nr:MFS transporter [Notoacmeibacter marinus]OXT02196.1 MFS transporter [Notoacmeibacter marinus]
MMTYPASPEPVARAHNPLAFPVLAIVQATLIFTIAIVAVPLPVIAEEFGLTAADLLLVLAAYGLPFSGLLLFGGRLADRFGGRRMFAIGLIVFGASSAVAAAAPNYPILVAMRLAQGIGGAIVAPAAMAVLRALFPEPAAFGRAMATWGGVSVLGAVLGFIVSGVLTTWMSWRFMFAIPVAVSLIGLVSTPGLLPRGISETAELRPRLDLVGAVFATLGISLSSFGLIATGDHGWTSTMVLLPLGTGIILLVAFFLLERKVRDPLLPPGFILEPVRITGLVGMFLAAAGSGVINFVLSLYLQQVLGWSPLMTALAFVPFAVALIATGQLAAPQVERFGAARITGVGLIVAAVGLALLTQLTPDTRYLQGLLPGIVLIAVGISLAFSGSAVLSTTNVPQRRAGLAGGVMNTAMELGPTVGLAILMSVAATQVETVTGYAWAFGTAAVAYTFVALLSFAFSGRVAASAAAGASPE